MMESMNLSTSFSRYYNDNKECFEVLKMSIDTSASSAAKCLRTRVGKTLWVSPQDHSHPGHMVVLVALVNLWSKTCSPEKLEMEPPIFRLVDDHSTY